MPNRLANETSPYLLQHQHNPIDWYPWGPEALAKAKQEDKPLLVSIGYAACHWCHVMERECFENPAIAELMNRDFICIKVDREERPDIDAIYIEAVQMMTGRAGWPLNVFLTPEQVPFYGGTYYPPTTRGEMPSWPDVLTGISDAWQQQREEIVERSAQLKQHLERSSKLASSQQPPTEQLLQQAVEQAQDSYDPLHAGFGDAPKFPPTTLIEFLFTQGEQQMTLHTLQRMASGGIYDQIGGGFARYSVDRQWQIPHFEKMLYDNALLARCYLHAWQISKNPLFERVCRETLDWMLREMQAAEGGFYSSIDADSEGTEGSFYVFTEEEIRSALDDPELSDEAIRYFGVTASGNFEGSNALQRNEPEPQRLGEIRCKLFGVRAKRIRPETDEKRLTAWNALAISSLAEAGVVLGQPQYTAAAERCAEFLLKELRDNKGRLLRSYNQGRAQLAAYLEDYAFLLEALIELYQATFNEHWFNLACELADGMIEHFADNDLGGFFSTAHDHEQLLARRKEIDDAPIPSGNSSAALGLLKLAELSGNRHYSEHGLAALTLASATAAKYPQTFGHLLLAINFYLTSTKQVTLLGEGSSQWRHSAAAIYNPCCVFAGCDGDPESSSVALLNTHTKPPAGQTVALICEGFSCQSPVTDLTSLLQKLSTN